jgi:O-Antigen ligase
MRYALARSWRDVAFGFGFALALLTGGGGAEGLALNGIIAGFGAILLGTLVADHLSNARPLPGSAIAPVVAITFVLLVVLFQIIPLPATVWQRLPGRETMAAALSQVGALGTARPISIDPAATIAWATALLMPAAVLLHLTRTPPATLRIFYAILIACAALSGLVGALQLALGHPDILALYDGPTRGAASGLFANTNHQALLMVVAVMALATFPRPAQVRREPPASTTALLWGGIGFFALMVIASGSRAGLLMLAGTLPIAMLLRLRSATAAPWITAVGLAGALIGALFLLYPGTNTLAVRESFSVTHDLRAAYLPDLLLTLWQYWPTGSGLGTFTTAFPPNENLDVVTSAFLNHAHDDFLEALIEGGLAGAVAVLLAIGAVGVFAGKRLIAPSADRRLVAGAALILLACCVHSLVDYPMRTATIATVAAFAAGVIFQGPTPIGSGKPRGATAWAYAAIVLVCALVGFEAVRLNLIASALRAGRADEAAALGSHDALVLAAEVDRLLAAGRQKPAERLAAQAVARQPMNPAAVTLLARTEEALAKPTAGIWQVATRLGWRDPSTQYWAVRYALRGKQPEIAVLRADALLRTSKASPQLMRGLRIAANDGAFRSALVDRLSLEPSWQAKFFAVAPGSSVDELNGVFATVAQQAGTGSSPGIEARPLIATLIANRQFEAAARLYRLLHEGKPADDLVPDAQFAKAPDDYTRSTMFDWRLLGGPTVSVSVDPSAPSRLVIENAGERTKTASDLHLPLAQGRYELEYRFRADQDDAALVRLSCLQPFTRLAERRVQAAPSFAIERIPVELTKPCSMARLEIVSLVSERAAPIEFDEISIRPLSLTR